MHLRQKLPTLVQPIALPPRQTALVRAHESRGVRRVVDDRSGDRSGGRPRDEPQGRDRQARPATDPSDPAARLASSLVAADLARFDERPAATPEEVPAPRRSDLDDLLANAVPPVP